MTRTYEVFWTGVAETDLLDIVTHIAEDNVETALDILAEVKTRADTLQSTPDRGRIVPELHKHGILLYRELIIDPWRLMYRTMGDTVAVVAVIDSRRNVEDVLLSRLIR
jgi:plasmid stabilization system protein ParE